MCDTGPFHGWPADKRGDSPSLLRRAVDFFRRVRGHIWCWGYLLWHIRESKLTYTTKDEGTTLIAACTGSFKTFDITITKIFYEKPGSHPYASVPHN